jgi:oligoendopeptidase F
MSAEAALEEVRWNLADLLDGAGDTADGAQHAPAAAVEALLDDALARAERFAATYRGTVASLDATGLQAAMRELAEIEDRVGRAGSYAGLAFATDTSDAARGALLQRVEERGTELQTMLVFFELEWAALDDASADALLADDGIAFARHHLRTVRRYRPHLLSEPEERILAEKAVSSRSAWARLFAEHTAAIEVQLEEPLPLDVALSRLSAPSRDVRRDTAQAVTAALEPGLRTRAFIFNTLLAEKAADDRLRSYDHWLASRNLSNEASDESVAALIEAVRGRFEIARRWYRLKAKLLGIERLADYDRMAPLSNDDVEVPWSQACELVLDAYSSFSPTLGDLVQRFFDESWIDAPPSPGKRGGAFCASTVPSVHPYVLLNYTARRGDVLTLAHELGHGVHGALAAREGIFHQNTPLTVAETASVFGEALTFGRLLEASPTPAARLALLAEDLEGAIATVFRQVAMNGFEALAHNERRSVGELSVPRLGELWMQTQEELLGDSVQVTENYAIWWSYIPHFINSPGYVYAYAYGQLLALSVYQRYLEVGAGFEAQYVELLSSGGSRSPEELGEIVGLDLRDPTFWERGLDLIEARLGEAEAAAAAL